MANLRDLIFVLVVTLRTLTCLSGLPSKLRTTPKPRPLTDEDVLDPRLTSELNEIPERKCQLVERISALVGEDYATDEFEGHPKIIHLSIIQAAVLALQESNANMIEPFIRGRHVDKKKYKETYERSITRPCKKFLKLYEKFAVNIEEHWTKNSVPYLRREGRLKIWANDCAYLVDSKTIDEIWSELSSLVASSKPASFDDCKKHGCLKFYSQRRPH